MLKTYQRGTAEVPGSGSETLHRRVCTMRDHFIVSCMKPYVLYKTVTATATHMLPHETLSCTNSSKGQL
jgi:hypothetical protein